MTRAARPVNPPAPAPVSPAGHSSPQSSPPLRRFSVDEYYRMAEVGILKPDEKLELIDGAILKMSPSGPTHASVTSSLEELLKELIGKRATVRVQFPIRLDDRNEPEPDIAVVQRGRYMTAHPAPADVFFLVEVADSSLLFDKRDKAELYARAGVPEYWLVDLPNRAFHIHREPADGKYQKINSITNADDAVSPAAFEDVAVKLKDVLS